MIAAVYIRKSTTDQVGASRLAAALLRDAWRAGPGRRPCAPSFARASRLRGERR